MAINIFQLLFGLAIFVYGTLYAVIHKIWTPTVEPYLYTSTNKTRTKNKKTKGKKGKSKPKVAAARKVEIINAKSAVLDFDIAIHGRNILSRHVVEMHVGERLHSFQHLRFRLA